jgi:hypothetical protein
MDMKRFVFLLLALATLTWSALAAPPQPTSKEHPIIGRWTITLPDGSCSETYTFRPDGTTLVTSGEEIAETVFEISAKPSASGFYKMTDKLVKDNGKKDCSGAITEVGQTATNYVQFHQSNNLFIMCADESLNTCIGPFRRVQGMSI